MLPSSTDNLSTPLPMLPMSVLSITMLGEFLSSNVSVPYALFMVKGFGFPEDADAAFWTGILVAMFFLSQFLTSLLWATLAKKYGRRFVLVITLFGSAASVTAFGLSKTMWQAICIRLAQGAFAGSVGVARGSVVSITDRSNEGRAYAILGFCWGFGGLLGPILGGSFERPTERWPIFQNWKLLEVFPYLLPSVLAGLILLAGSILACFLGYDGGPRESPILIHPEKPYVIPNLNQHTLSASNYRRSWNGSLNRNELLGYLSNTNGLDSSVNLPISSCSPHHSSGIPLGPRTSTMSSSRSYPRNRTGSNTFGETSGSLYRQLLDGSSQGIYGSLSGSLTTSRTHEYFRNDVDTSSITERVVLANKDSITNLSDFWVAAALNIEDSPFNDDDNRTERGMDDGLEMPDPEVEGDNDLRGRHNFRRNDRPRSHPASMASRKSNQTFSVSRRTSRRRHSIPRNFATQNPLDTPGTPIPQVLDTDGFQPVFSTSGFRQSSLLKNLDHPEEIVPLPPILESRLPSSIHLDDEIETSSLINHREVPSTTQLPKVVILQFGLLALHTTTHDQIFMSYLVSAYDGGGLNLTASDFAQLIALMGIAQVVYQFLLYPPPRGPLSHLTMYQLGTLLFIPAYLTVVLYRTPFANPDDFRKLSLMTVPTVCIRAARYCGITFAFTSISVLLNYMTPPETVGFANGLAQTIVSLARFLGPMLGGWLWSASVEGHPTGYPFGFVICATVCAFAFGLTLFVK
ncbi:hypothetical protein BDP27DRAFT_1212386 [Rhodocollybia butyracea]|uniref:Major facilitator superfamily MFS-1 n=1 Tax=Rhodocollybia butyracea TaxID=206335 RepID=A0A9P5Q6A0_9AGAR|nr:hypothetical protein BDP27DRAFT_1212386 [Rhodocollybia butyracea]